MTIEVFSFSFSDTENMQICYQIRDEIFIKEQGIDKSLEFDGLDANAVHTLIRFDEKVVGTARWQDFNKEIKIERFGILSSYRGKALGTILIKYLIEDLKPSKKLIFLHAQEHAISFFKKNGFESEGEPFLEAGIKHCKMVYKPTR